MSKTLADMTPEQQVRHRAMKHAYYLRTIERAKARKKAQYWGNPEKARAASRKWYREHPEHAKATLTAYKSKHARILSEKQKARYWAAPEKHRAKAKKYAPNVRAAFLRRRERLDDVYVRGSLAKHSTLRPSEFPQELVEAKRLQLQMQRLIESKTQSK